MSTRHRFKIWSRIHQQASLFFLPLVAIYTLTGILSIIGFNEPKPCDRWTLKLDWNESQEAKNSQIAASLQLQRHKPPKGEIRYFHNMIIWGKTIDYHLKIHFNSKENISDFKLYNPNFYHKMLALHKNRGNVVFRYLTFTFCFCYIIVYFSGFNTVIAKKKIRKRAFIAFGAGVLTMLFFIYIS